MYINFKKLSAIPLAQPLQPQPILDDSTGMNDVKLPDDTFNSQIQLNEKDLSDEVTNTQAVLYSELPPEAMEFVDNNEAEISRLIKEGYSLEDISEKMTQQYEASLNKPSQMTQSIEDKRNGLSATEFL
jgi:hypothetical protein